MIKVTLNDKGNIVVNVPKGVSSEAPVKIKLIIQGKEIEMGESAHLRFGKLQKSLLLKHRIFILMVH